MWRQRGGVPARASPTTTAPASTKKLRALCPLTFHSSLCAQRDLERVDAPAHESLMPGRGGRSELVAEQPSEPGECAPGRALQPDRDRDRVPPAVDVERERAC